MKYLFIVGVLMLLIGCTDSTQYVCTHQHLSDLSDYSCKEMKEIIELDLNVYNKEIRLRECYEDRILISSDAFETDYGSIKEAYVRKCLD